VFRYAHDNSQSAEVESRGLSLRSAVLYVMRCVRGCRWFNSHDDKGYNRNNFPEFWEEPERSL